jgi:hypothetical protein
MRTFCYLLILSAFITACNNEPENTATNRTNGYSDKPQTKEDSLFKDVMHDHDDGMARMGKLTVAIRQLKSRTDSLIRAKRNPEAEKKILEELEYAEMAMNTWMREFNMDSLKDQVNRRLDYLEDEKKKVGQVRKNILESISRADSLLSAPTN